MAQQFNLALAIIHTAESARGGCADGVGAQCKHTKCGVYVLIEKDLQWVQPGH